MQRFCLYLCEEKNRKAMGMISLNYVHSQPKYYT